LTARALDRRLIRGPAGDLEIAVTQPGVQPRGVAVIAHPHPLYGGTLDNKVVQTLAKAFATLGLVAVRFNFRGVGRSAGNFDEGRGEIEDLLAVVRHARAELAEGRLALAGFSFGGYVAAQAARALETGHLALVAPAVNRFTVPAVPPQTLVVHGEEDDVVPLKDLMDWARPQRLPVVVFPGTGHFFHGMLIALHAVVARYFRD
jgi:alpha/beta superfamily hydrolase